MIQKLHLIVFCLVALLIFLSNSSNPPNGYTGAPGEDTCNACHSGSNPALDGEISISGLPSSVDANTTYPITITLTNPNGVASRGGFQWVAIDEDDSNAGDIDNASSGSTLMTSFGREYHEHSGSNFFGGSSLIWTADWTAPDLSQDTEVTLYATGVIGNGSGSGNDRVVLVDESVTINAATLPLEAEIDSQSDPLCFDGEDGSATLSVSGGTPPYSYDWENGESTNPAVSLEAGFTLVEVMDDNDNSVTVLVSLNEPNEIEIDEIFNNSPICLNGENGEAEVEAIGGVPPYQYSWSDGQSGPIAFNLEEGFYTVQVLDDNGCSENIIVTITEQELQVTIEGDLEYCESSSTSLVATSGYESYLWNTGEVTESIIVNTPDDYSVIVSDSDGCTGIAYANVEEIELIPFVINGPLEICNGMSAQLSTSEEFESYEWSTGELTETIIVNGPNNYSVIVSDSDGCTGIAYLNIEEVELTPFTISGPSEICPGISVQLGTSEEFESYEWSTGELTETIIVNGPNNYSVIVSDSDGCTGIAYLNIEEIELTPFTISGPSEVCPGISVQLSTSEEFESYEWSDGSILPTLLIDTCATYYVTVTDFQGCIQFDSITLNCSQELDIILIENSPVSCSGDCDGILEAGLANNTTTLGSWSTGSTFNRITDLCPGLYTYTVVDTTGCITSETYEVIEPLAIDLTIDTLIPPICSTDTTSFIAVHATGGLGPYSYLWPEDMIGDTITQFGSGIYQVTVVDSKSCVDSFEITVPDVLPLGIEVEEVVNVDCFGDATGQIITSAIGGHGGYLFQWNTGGNDSMIIDLAADTYSLTVTDTLGCSESTLIPVLQNDEITYTSTVTPESEIGASDGSITVIPVGGNGNYTYLWNNGETTPTITDLAPGLYSCIISDNLDCQLTISESVNMGGCLIDISTVISHVTCNGDNNGSINIEVTNGIPPYEITVVDSNDIIQDGNQLEAGSYVVIASDSVNCIAEQLFTIMEPSELSIDIQLISQPTCIDKEDGLAIVNVTGGEPPYDYEWDTGSIISETDLGALLTGVTVTDKNNCQISSDITAGFEDKINPEVNLQPLTINISESGGIVIPDPISFNLSSSDNCSSLIYTYEDEPVVLCGSATYNVDIRVTDESDNFSIGTTTLTVRDTIQPVLSCPEDISVAFCEQVVYEISAIDNCSQEVILTLTEGLESEEDFEVGTTVVSYTATDNSNNVTTCSFSVTRLAQVPLTASGIDVSCFGGNDGEITIDDNGVIYVEVTSNGTGLDQLSAGMYEIEAVDQNGCITSTNVSIAEPSMIALNVIEVIDEITFDGNDGSISTTITGGVPPYEIDWYLDGILTDNNTQELEDLSPGAYTAQILDANSCEFTSDQIIVLEQLTSSVLNLDNSNNQLLARPNPAETSIQFILNGVNQNGIRTFEVYSIQGQQIMIVKNPIDLILDINEYQTGIYLTRITTTTESYSIRWSKQ